MIKNPQQNGSAHVIIIVVIVIAILGAVGFVFWQNFIATKDGKNKIQTQKTDTEKKKETAKKITYKTYQTDTHPISFQYPDAWEIENVQGQDQGGFSRVVNVKAAGNEKVIFIVGSQVGGICTKDFVRLSTTIDVVSTNFQTPRPTKLSFTVTPIWLVGMMRSLV